MNKRTIICISILVVFGILLGYMSGKLFNKGKEVEIIRVDTIVEHAKIDSFLSIIQEKDKEIENLKDNVKIIREIQYIRDTKIKDLPVDSGIELLRANLLTYGEFSMPEDTLPSLVEINNSDTLIAIGSNNLIDINLAYSDLTAEKEVNKVYQDIIQADSVIRLSQDSIIGQKNSIISKQGESIFSLESALKKEKRKKTGRSIFLGALAVVLGALNFVH